MSFAVWNPLLDCIAGADEARWQRATAIVAELGAERVTDLGGGSWRVMEVNAPDQESAAAELSRMLDSIDSGWRDVLRIAFE